MESTDVSIETGERLVTDVTGRVRQFCREVGSGAGADGLLHVFLPHATAGVALMETGSGSEADLAGLLDRLAPTDASYRHRHGSPGHGRDHVLPVFVAPSLSLPVIDAEVLLGTWQSVVVVDTNADNRTRRLRLTFLTG